MAINKRKILQSAQKHLQKGALDRALKDYQTLLQADPKDVNVRLKVGDLYLKQGNQAEAIHAYRKVAERFTEDGFDAKAVALYKQITKIDPKRIDVYVPLAELYERLGLSRDAVKTLQAAADGYYREGNKDEALDILRKMCALDPSNTINRLKVAELLRQAGRTPEAIAEFEEAATELQRSGDTDEHLRVLEKIVELAPDHASAGLELARLHLDQRRGLKAEAAARMFVEAHPGELEGWEVLVQALELLGRDEEAVDCWRELAELCKARGDDARARDIMQRYVATDGLGREVLGNSMPGFPSEASTDSPFASESPFDLAADGLGEGVSSPLAAGTEREVPSDETPVDTLELSDPQGVPFVEAPDASPRTPSGAGGGGGPELGTAAAATVDVEQSLAEAGVYLRYGKHDRAIETLRSVLACEPTHRGALEKLAEAHAAHGDAAPALEALQTALDLALREGEEAAAGRLRARIEALDPQAAPPSPPDTVTGGSDEAWDAVGGGDELELEIDGDLSDVTPLPYPRAARADELADLGLEPGAAEPAAPIAAPGEEGLELDLDLGLDIGAPPAPETGTDEPFGVETEPLLSAQPAGETDPDAARGAAAEAGGGSGSTPGEISEALEEAEFYFHQGLLADARKVFERVLAVAPNHPQALLRMGEIDAAGTGEAMAPEGAGAEIEIDAAEALALPGAVSEATARPDVAGAPGSTEPWPTAGEIEFDVEEERGASSDTSAEPTTDAGLGETPLAELDLALEPELEPTGAVPAGEEVSASTLSAEALLRPEPPGVESGAFERPVQALDRLVGREEYGSPAQPAPEPGLEEVTEPTVESPANITAPIEPAAVPETEPAADVRTVTAAEPAVAPETAGAVETPETESVAPPAAGGEFDLAAQLSGALETPRSSERGAGTEEEGFEQVFAAFKEGVQRELGDGDFEAHYDLGIAYKEMGLLEDALEEFLTAMQAPERKLSCLHMLGLCALELGRSTDAVAHLEQALALPDVPAELQVGLRYDLGRAYCEQGDRDRARSAFESVMATDPDFADAAARLEALADPAEASEAEGQGETVEAQEALESFDDLFEEVEAEAAPAEEQYESFEDLLEDPDEAAASPVVEESHEFEDTDGPWTADESPLEEAAPTRPSIDDEGAGSPSEEPASVVTSSANELEDEEAGGLEPLPGEMVRAPEPPPAESVRPDPMGADGSEAPPVTAADGSVAPPVPAADDSVAPPVTAADDSVAPPVPVEEGPAAPPSGAGKGAGPSPADPEGTDEDGEGEGSVPGADPKGSRRKKISFY